VALSRTQSVFTYQSSAGGEAYYFDIVIDEQAVQAVRNIRNDRGLITDSLSQVPETVVDDITEAMEAVQLLVAESSVVTGTEVFSGQTSRTVTIAGGVLNNANYRVHLTPPDGTLLRVENKTTTSFDIVASTTYGAAGTTKSVDWVVYVSTAQASSFGGVLTYNAGDTSQAVAFPSAVATADYRVLLEPSDFFSAKVTSKTRNGFTVVIGIDPDPGSVTVGYDVIV